MIRCADISLSNTLCVCLRLGLVDTVDPIETVEMYLVWGPAVLMSTEGR